MSDTTDLLDNACSLLRSLQLAEYAHNVRHYEDLDSVLSGVDPVEVRLAIRDLRELVVRLRALEDLRVEPSSERRLPASDPDPNVGVDAMAPVVPSSTLEHPGYSVKVPCR